MNLKFTIGRTTLFFIFLLSTFWGWTQTTYTFTNASAAGKTGPTQVMVDAEYAGTNLQGNVTVTAGIQYWTVPTTGNYKIECFGAQGFGSFGGRGAQISGEFNLTAGTTLKILVGQKAPPPVSSMNQYAGGGGSFVTSTTNTPYVIAGGGGGNHGTSFVTTADASITNNGFAGAASNSGAGGTAGSGGLGASSADAGGGLTGNGGGIGGGFSFTNGGVGGAGTTTGHGEGGFGCGGGTSSWDNYRAGGGGGYSGGGGGGENGQINAPAGGGGGSFNGGTNPIANAGVQIGDGLIVITSLQTFPNDAGISGFSGVTPPFCNGPLPVSAIVQNYGNNVVSQVSVFWTVNGVAQTPISVTTPMDTIGGVGLSSLTVSLGNAMVTGPTTIIAWTVSPNGSSDTQTFNDTNSFNVSPFGVNATTAFNVNCFGDAGGLITTTTDNASGSVSYSWSDGSTGQNLVGATAGTYTVTATNGNCTDTASATITSPPQITANDATVDVSCFGGNDGSSTLFISGGTPNYSVSWPGFGTGAAITNLPGGTHAYVITDGNGCQTTDSITVGEPLELIATSTITQVTTGNNGAIDVTVTGGTPVYTYLWSPGNQTTEDISSLTPGTYTVTVTDGNGCMTALSNTVLDVVGLDETEITFGSKVYPNPSNERFTIETTNAPDAITIEVFDLLGKRIQLIENANTKTNIYLKEREGVYLIKVTSGNESYIKRVILQK